MIEHDPSIQRPSNPDASLWRFMDFTKYVSMLHRGALYFARADQLPDPFEGVGRRTRRGAHDAGSRRQDRVFLNCWHQNEHESAAMWRIYLSSQEGVAIRTSVKRLQETLMAASEQVYLGAVRYIDYDTEVVAAGEVAPYFCKRQSFDYEREVRALLRAEHDAGDPGLYLEADLSRLITEVVTSPDAEPWLSDLVRSVTEKYGLRLRVVDSSLSEPPP
ncbi:MAG: hypothetical protein HOW73_14795 [Polyangiaceae bacterium]|nr:hypothetical protein [Polyangiaceae bacterium]